MAPSENTAKRLRVAGKPRGVFSAVSYRLLLFFDACRRTQLLIRVLTVAAITTTLGLCVLGLLRDEVFGDALAAGVITSLTALLGVHLHRRFSPARPADGTNGSQSAADDFGFGALFVAAAFAIIEVSGGPDGPLYPLLYLTAAFSAAFFARRTNAALLLLIVGTEAGLIVGVGASHTPEALRGLISHTSFLLLFSALFGLFLRGDIMRQRRNSELLLRARIDSIESEARDFRLSSSVGPVAADISAGEMKRRRRVGSVEAIHGALCDVMVIAERSLSLHSVVLLWLDVRRQNLRVIEHRSESSAVCSGFVGAGAGLVGAVVQRREPVVLTRMRPGHQGLVYYEEMTPVTDFIGVPVMHGEDLQGVLCGDRIDGVAFGAADLEQFTVLAGAASRAVQVERLFSAMDDEKYKKERFYQASREFNEVLTVEEVAEVAQRATQRVTEAELVAVAVSERTEGMMHIAAITWDGHADLSGLLGMQFKAESTLVGAAINARHPLPHGNKKIGSAAVFGPGFELDIPAVKVLPLLWKGYGIGAIVLGGKQNSSFDDDGLEMIKVVGDHAAMAIANAQMYERMEQLATTDGLTGLTNHRAFQEHMDDMLRRGRRYQRPVSIALTDIDHFKAINDTHGHPVGDKVLSRVAQVLLHNARCTDVVARYGGEEFAVVMEETDIEGARLIAERIRQSIEAEVFAGTGGNFGCTLSLGIATFPADGDTKAELIAAADKALYAAKNNGRNQTKCATEITMKQSISA